MSNPDSLFLTLCGTYIEGLVGLLFLLTDLQDGIGPIHFCFLFRSSLRIVGQFFCDEDRNQLINQSTSCRGSELIVGTRLAGSTGAYPFASICQVRQESASYDSFETDFDFPPP